MIKGGKIPFDPHIIIYFTYKNNIYEIHMGEYVWQLQLKMLQKRPGFPFLQFQRF